MQSGSCPTTTFYARSCYCIASVHTLTSSCQPLIRRNPLCLQVRGVAVCPLGILTASRDKTVKLWAEDKGADGHPGYTLTQTMVRQPVNGGLRAVCALLQAMVPVVQGSSTIAAHRQGTAAHGYTGARNTLGAVGDSCSTLPSLGRLPLAGGLPSPLPVCSSVRCRPFAGGPHGLCGAGRLHRPWGQHGLPAGRSGVG